MRSLPLGRHEHEGPSQGRRAPKPEGGHRRPQRETGRQTRESPLPSGLGHHAHYRLLQYYLPLDLPIGSPTTHQAAACTAHGTAPHPGRPTPGWTARITLASRARGPCGQAGSITVVGDVRQAEMPLGPYVTTDDGPRAPFPGRRGRRPMKPDGEGEETERPRGVVVCVRSCPGLCARFLSACLWPCLHRPRAAAVGRPVRAPPLSSDGLRPLLPVIIM